jgi:AcrR family transcriptional regulator
MLRSEDMPRPTRRFAERRETILAVATEVFRRKGLKGASLAEVAQSVGLLTPSITYYFRKKEDLAAACLLRSIETYDGVFAKAGREPDPASRIEASVRLYFALQSEIAKGERAAPLPFDDMKALPEPTADAVHAAYAQMFRRVRAFFDMPGNTAAARRARSARAHLLLATLFWVPAWIKRYDVGRHSGVAEGVSDILLRGLKGDDGSWSCLERRDPLPVGELDTPREAFLLAATKLINETGYRGASVEKISAKLNVTKGSFYHHNTNKDDLVVDCFERTFAVVQAAQDHAVDDSGSGWERLLAASSNLVDFQLSPQGPLLRTTALYAIPQEIRHEMVARINRQSDRFAEFVADGMRDGSIRAVDPVIGGELVISMINGAASLPRWSPGISSSDAAEHYVKPLLGGLVA